MKTTLRPRHLLLAILVILVPVCSWAQHPLAKKYREQSTLKGRANPDMQLKSMMFAFQLQNRQELKQLLADQQNPNSVNYHRWLTPQEFGSRFGVSQAQYQRTVEWLQSNGFSVKMQPGNRLRIYFEGAAQDVERSFGVNIGLYEYNGKTYYSNDLSPQIPGEFQNVAFGILGLDNFPKEHPLYQNGNHPLLAPADAQVGYNLVPLISSGIDGTGQSIAVVELSDFNISDVQVFRNIFGLKQNDPQKLFVTTNPGIDTSGGETEALLDAEWAGAIAPGATIQVVIAANQDLQGAMDYVIDQLFTTRVMGVSFGDGESDLGSSSQALPYIEFLDSFFMQAASQGQTVVVASGDEGVLQALGNGSNSTGPDINYLCASGYVVCVGGTTLNLQFDGSGNATQYLGETVWNNHRAGSNFAASGGGKSKYVTKPDFQFGPGVPNDGFRDVPDVAAAADPGGPGALLVLNGVIDNHTYGGTSLSTPMWGGVFALVNQYASMGGVGWANPRLYQIGSAQQAHSGPQVFNDVTSGNNSAPTVTGFNATPGFDLATGWGSFNGDLFVRNFVVQAPAGVPIDNTPQVTGTIPPSASTTGCGLNPTQYAVNVPAGALQLVVKLDGPANGDVDLYVRKGQSVGDTGFFNPYIADYTSQGSTAHEAVYIGPNSPNPLTAGTYYIAVSNCMQTAAAFTLSASVITPSTPTKIEELSTDNGILEDYFNPTGSTNYPPSGVNGTIVVSRLRPTRYPSTLTKIRIYSTLWDQNYDPAGKPFRLIAFNDPAGTGNPPSAPTLLVNQQVTIPGSNGFMEYTISNPPVIQSGDWYVGFQHPAAYNGVLVSMNEGGVWAQADFVSTNNAASFTGPYQQPNPYSPPNFYTPNFMIRAVVQSQGQTTSTVNLNVPPVGAVSDTTSQANAQLQVGYATASTTSGTAPFGTAVFNFSQSGNVVTEVGVPASVPTTEGRIFIDYRTGVAAKSGQLDAGTISIDTGMALVNRGTATANITFTLHGLTGGAPIATGHYNALVQNGHTALFIDQLNSIAPDFVLPSNFPAVTQFGSLDIVSDQPLSILALRQTTNQQSESLLTSTPMADLTQSLSAVPLYFPQFADGNGYTTMVVLLNTSSATETGTLKLFQNGGTPLVVKQVGGSSNSSFPYSIQPGGVYVFQSDGSPSVVNAGSAQVIPDTGMNTPVGAGVFSFTEGGVLVTQSGIPSATPTTHARIYVDESGGHDTGLAIANPGALSVNVTLNAFATDGITPAGTSAGPLSLSGNGHDAKFAGQFISGLPAGFTGVLDISSPQSFVALTLRSLTNARGDSLLTTFPIADFTQIAPNPLIFPQIVDSNGYQTQIILLSTSNSSASAVTVNYFGDNGAPIALKSAR
jgi:pseudomonalisin